MKLFVFRHGETDRNRDGITQGREDVPLNDAGRRQAQAIAAAYGGRTFAAVYSSPLSRARETAAPLASRLGLEIRDEPALIEMDVGELGSLTGEEMQRQHGGFIKEWLGPGVPDLRMPGGETLREVQERAWQAVERIAAAHEGQEVAAFTHNFVALGLLCRALSLDLALFRRVRHDLGALSILVLEPGRVRVEAMNERGHLAGCV